MHVHARTAADILGLLQPLNNIISHLKLIGTDVHVQYQLLLKELPIGVAKLLDCTPLITPVGKAIMDFMRVIIVPDVSIDMVKLRNKVSCNAT